MPALLNRPLNADMGAQVHGLLNALCKLPDRGIVAGQAVTSALLRLYADSTRQGPFNDIDVFVSSPKRETALDMSFQLRRSKPLERSDEYLDAQGITAELVRSNQIIAVTNEGLLNIVTVNPRDVKFSGPTMQLVDKLGATTSEIISDFDLNCVQVGLDLSTRQLSWTPAFDRFIKTQEIQLTTIQSEFHTLGRLHKKLEEMPWAHADLAVAQDLLTSTFSARRITDALHLTMDRHHSLVMDGIEPIKRHQFDLLPVVGSISKNKFERFEATMSSCFQLKKLKDTSYWEVRATRKLEEDERLQRIFGHHAKWLCELSAEHAETMASNRVGKFSKTMFKGKHKTARQLTASLLLGAPGFIYDRALAQSADTKSKLKIVVQALARVDMPVPEIVDCLDGETLNQAMDRHRLDSVINRHALSSRSVRALGAATYLKGPVEEQAILDNEEFINRHAKLLPCLIGLTASEQSVAIQNVRGIDELFEGRAIEGMESTGIEYFSAQVLLDRNILEQRMRDFVETAFPDFFLAWKARMTMRDLIANGSKSTIVALSP